MVEKFKAVFPNTVMGSHELYFEEMATETEGKFTLPLIGIKRVGWSLDKQRFNHLETWYGSYNAVDQNTGKNYFITALPIAINYQIDIYAEVREVVDKIAAELMFFLWKHPKLMFEVVKPFQWTCLDSDIWIDDILENSDLGNFSSKGRLYRTTYDIKIDNAKLYESELFHVAEEVPVEIKIIE
jgi:hypothetical protein